MAVYIVHVMYMCTIINNACTCVQLLIMHVHVYMCIYTTLVLSVHCVTITTYNISVPTGHQSLTSAMELQDNILVSGNADSTVKVK